MRVCKDDVMTDSGVYFKIYVTLRDERRIFLAKVARQKKQEEERMGYM